jgi:hypothetical protein
MLSRPISGFERFFDITRSFMQVSFELVNSRKALEFAEFAHKSCPVFHIVRDG